MDSGHPERYITQDQEGVQAELETFITRIEQEIGRDRQSLFDMGLVRITHQELINPHSLEPSPNDHIALLYYGETPAAAVFQTRDEHNWSVIQPVWLGIHHPHAL